MKIGSILQQIARFTLAVALIQGAFCGLNHAMAFEGYDGHDRGSENETPEQLRNVGITEHLGSAVDLNLTFRDETGATVRLGQFFDGRRPVLLSLAYYSCPGLCNFHLNGLKDTFKELKGPLGQEFDHVVVSIDPRENSELAAKKKASYVTAYGRVEGAKGWHFLVGDEANIRQLAQQVGFNYHWDEKEKQWAHASAAYVLTPKGLISRYLYGIVFDAKVLRLSMIEASNGMIGSIVDKLTLFCFHFDPQASKYTFYAFNVMRAAAGIAVLILATVLGSFWLRGRKELQGEA